jgi:hypothetical protein
VKEEAESEGWKSDPVRYPLRSEVVERGRGRAGNAQDRVDHLVKLRGHGALSSSGLKFALFILHP